MKILSIVTGLLAGCVVLAVYVTVTSQRQKAPPAPVAPVSFANHTQQSGLLTYSPSFALVVADVDGNSRDDILVGNHGYPPSLFLNREGGFEDHSDVLPIPDRADRHGYTVVDLDNDGDRDLIYAGGGADGIGRGSPNRLFRNLRAQTGNLAFEEDPRSAAISYRHWRARQFLPLANPAGDKVDLYLTALHKRREDSTNLYFANTSKPGEIGLDADGSSSLNQRFESNGMDVFFDFDRDGDPDFLRLGQLRTRLYENRDGIYRHLPSALDELARVESVAVADLNNDGFMDLYYGGLSGHTGSDNVSNNSQEIHMVIVNQEGDDIDRIAFRMRSARMRINFVEHLSEQGRNRTNASDIYLGAQGDTPAGRAVRVGRNQARGEPADFSRPGTYLWFDLDERLWHVLWKHDPDVASDAKGIISGTDIELVSREQLETNPPRQVRDYIAMNQQGRGWKVLDLPELEHTFWTNDVTAADFNNDGLVDVAGVRSRDYAAENGDPFLLLNHGDLRFTRHDALVNREDNIFRADLIVHGFFNDDGLPDLFYTNGAGLMPSHRGPYQLWLNTSGEDAGYILVELVGTGSNRDAIGAQVELRGPDGALLGYRELGPGYGRSQDTHKLHFGLGARQGPFTLHIRWPGRERPQVVSVAANSFQRIVQGEPAPRDSRAALQGADHGR